MMRFLLVLLVNVVLATGVAAAQPGKRHEGKERQMSQEERERMREDMRDAYRSRPPERPQKMRQMSPEERGRLRRDIEDANKNLKR
jgi:Ni/Co efflux regulator RcnB